jgi:hypothetical protein
MARRGPPFPEIHYLLLDRKDRKSYIARREQNLILLALAQPQEEDPHTLYVDELLMSPGTENYKVPPSKLGPLREFGMRFKFYLNHGQRALEYDDHWRVYYPEHSKCTEEQDP